jgi:hypothetical protein
MKRFALYKTNTLSWIFIVLGPWSNSWQVDVSLHSNTLSLFQANCVVYLIPFFLLEIFGLTRPWLQPTIYHTRDEHANHYTTDAVPLSSEATNYTPYKSNDYCTQRDNWIIRFTLFIILIDWLLLFVEEHFRYIGEKNLRTIHHVC